MTEALLRLLSRRMLVQQEWVGANGEMECTNPLFWDLIGVPVPRGTASLCDIFPEFIGMDDEITMLARQESGEILLPLVNRVSVRSGTETAYFDLTLIADASTRPNLLLLAADVTEQSRHQRRLMQSRNENMLLQEKLERQNELIRDHTHSLEDAVHRRTVELRETRLELIRRLALAAERRDPQATGHLARMSRYSVMIARRVGLDDDARQLIYNASLLHDVGKIAIPDRILQKPGPLSDEEFAEMRRHTLYGAEMLAGSRWGFMQTAASIARSHHERWDGRGYPDGLSATDIPLMGRICAVADVFDALTMVRPYKGPWSVDDAAAHIASQSGQAFDPDLAGAFTDILPDIRRAQSQSGDGTADVEDLPEG